MGKIFQSCPKFFLIIILLTELVEFLHSFYLDFVSHVNIGFHCLVVAVAEAGEKFPLVLFMADASTAGKEVTAPLAQGYGALEFASDRDLISRGPLSLYEVDAYTMIMNGGLQQIKDYL